ncbi:MAG: tetratricopeptide repeat protein [Limisphaerales bacterium]
MNLPTGTTSPAPLSTEADNSSATTYLAKIAAGLALLTLFVFLPAVNCEFINYDDDVFVTNNPKVAAGLTWEGIKWAFTSADIDYWRPLSWLSHMLDVELFGPVAGAHHLMNLLIHCAAVVMAFLALHRLTRAVWPSAVVAALFAWHPLHVESVVWVAERKDVLCGFFWFFTLWAYARYVESPSPRNYLTVFAGFVLGVMSKPMIVTLPCVLFLLDYWPLRRIDASVLMLWRSGTWRSSLPKLWALVREKLPLLAVIAVLSVSTVYSQHRVGTLSKMDEWSAVLRFQNALVSYASYLVQTVLPVDLCVIYPLKDIPAWQWLASGLLLVAISLASLRLARRAPFVIVGWLWFVGVMVPVIGILQVGGQARADRYTYLPLTGVFIAVVWGAFQWAGGHAGRQRMLSRGVFLALLGCALVARSQIPHWETSVTVFRRAVDVTSKNVIALNNLASELLIRNQPREALRYAQEAAGFTPWQMPWINVMSSHLVLNDYPSAQRAMLAALKLDPKSDLANGAIQQLAFVSSKQPENILLRKLLVSAHVARGDFNAAALQLAEVARIAPNDIDARIDRAAYLAAAGKEAEAITVLEDALKQSPANALAHSNLGSLLTRQGRTQEAISHHLAALAADPENYTSRHNYALLLARTGRTVEARNEFERVLQRNRDFEPTLQRLAWLLATRAECRDGTQALALATRLLQVIKKDTPENLDAFGAAAAAAGDFDRAIKSAQMAIDLARKNNQAPLADAIRARLSLYQSHQPYTESSVRPPSLINKP